MATTDRKRVETPVVALCSVVVVNLVGFVFEFSLGTSIGAVSLVSDSIDFLEDASLNLLVLFAIGWGALWRRRVGIFLAGLMLVPALAALWLISVRIDQMLGTGVLAPPGSVDVPDASMIIVGGLVAALFNIIAVMILLRVRQSGSSLLKAAYLSARNDVLSNGAIVLAGLATFLTLSVWPDVIAGVLILAINAGAAVEVYQAAQSEHKQDTV